MREPIVQVEKSFVVGNGDVKITFLPVKINAKLTTTFQVGKHSDGTRKINLKTLSTICVTGVVCKLLMFAHRSDAVMCFDLISLLSAMLYWV